MRKRSVQILLLALGVLLAAFAALAQSDQESTEPIYNPPRITAERIGVLEAVRLALQNDPNIRLQATSVDLQRGIAQEESGRFDPTITGELSYQFTQDELNQQQIQAQIDKRHQVAELADQFGDAATQQEELLAEIVALQQDPEEHEIVQPADCQDNPPGPNCQSAQEIQNQIDLINTLIAGTEDDAIRARFRQLRDEEIERVRQTTENLAIKFRQKEAEELEKLRKMGQVPTINEHYFGSLNVSFIKPFRSGVVFTPFFNLSGEGFDFRGKRKDSDFGGKGTKDLYRSDTGFSFTIPLARGAGADSVAAFEKSAQIDYEASKLALQHQASTTVFSTLLAYWNLVAAQQAVESIEESTRLQGRLVELTDALIEGDELPGAERPRVQARAADIDSQLLGARRSLHSARITLARVMGLAVDSAENAPLASDTFPAPPDPDVLTALVAERLGEEAVENRNDYKASMELQKSGKVLLKAARLDLKPLLNLNSSIKYTGLGEGGTLLTGTSRATLEKWVGPSVSTGLSLELPLGNNVQQGRYVQAEASYRQRAISTADLRRNIKANVANAVASLREAAEQVRQASQAVDYYREVNDNEIEKLRLGAATVIDTILTQQRLTDALLTLVSARSQYASLLSQLRFETATLVETTPEASTIREQELMAVPVP